MRFKAFRLVVSHNFGVSKPMRCETTTAARTALLIRGRRRDASDSLGICDSRRIAYEAPARAPLSARICTLPLTATCRAIDD